MKEKLINNIGLKLLSIGLAICIWFLVVDVVNPLVVNTQEIPVEIINADILTKSNLTYNRIGKNTVTISYEIRTRDRYKINASDFYAYADLAELYDVTGSIPIRVDVVDQTAKSLIEGSVTAKQGVVRIETEALQRKQFEVAASTDGVPADGYAIGNIIVRPEHVFVSGAVSAVGQISSVGVELQTTGAEADLSGKSKVYLYDANGNKLDMGEKVTVSQEEVEYQVNILKVKNLNLDFQVSGEVAPGYRFTGVESSSRYVAVEGMKSVLASISTLTIPGDLLSVEGATSDVTVEVDLNELLPDNISMANASETTVMVTLKVERLAIKAFEIDTDDLELIGTSDDFSYSFDDDSVYIRVSGLSEDLAKLSEDDLICSADVTDLDVGDHEVDIEVEPGDGFELLEPHSLLIHVEGDEDYVPYGEGGTPDEGDGAATEGTRAAD